MSIQCMYPACTSDNSASAKYDIWNYMIIQRWFGTLSKHHGDDDSEEELLFFISSFVIVMHCNAM
jgi:hypothetical protein